MGGLTSALAAHGHQTYLRIDDIEHVLRVATPLGENVDSAGYGVSQAIARSNLLLGNQVIADCVNPVRASREAWRSVAAKAHVPIVEIEVICSDIDEHRRRVEQRTVDIEGLALPSWASILAGGYEPRAGARLVIDTARHSVAEAVTLIEAAINQCCNGPRQEPC